MPTNKLLLGNRVLCTCGILFSQLSVQLCVYQQVLNACSINHYTPNVAQNKQTSPVHSARLAPSTGSCCTTTFHCDSGMYCALVHKCALQEVEGLSVCTMSCPCLFVYRERFQKEVVNKLLIAKVTSRLV